MKRHCWSNELLINVHNDCRFKWTLSFEDRDNNVSCNEWLVTAVRAKVPRSIRPPFTRTASFENSSDSAARPAFLLSTRH